MGTSNPCTLCDDFRMCTAANFNFYFAVTWLKKKWIASLETLTSNNKPAVITGQLFFPLNAKMWQTFISKWYIVYIHIRRVGLHLHKLQKLSILLTWKFDFLFLLWNKKIKCDSSVVIHYLMGVTKFADLPGNQVSFVVLHFHGTDILLAQTKGTKRRSH